MSRDRSVVLDDLTAAVDELHDAQRTAAILAVDTEGAPRTGVTIARQIIERDLAARRVEAWTSLVDRLRTEARTLGLFDR